MVLFLSHLAKAYSLNLQSISVQTPALEYVFPVVEARPDPPPITSDLFGPIKMNLIRCINSLQIRHFSRNSVYQHHARVNVNDDVKRKMTN